MPRGVVIILIGITVACAYADADVTGYEALSDWSTLPLAAAGSNGLISSYDRAGGNNDWNQYLSPAGHLNDPADDGIDTVVTTLTGPGVITRFWMPHAGANAGDGGVLPVKITVDGVLVIDTDTNALLEGSYNAADASLFNSPLVNTLVGGQVSYEPIAFQNSLTIETRNYTTGTWGKRHHYYQYNYRQLPAGTTVTPYTGTLTPAQQSDRTATADMINNVGQNPAGTIASASTFSLTSESVAANTGVRVAELSGSGHVRALHIKMPGASDTDLDGLRLRVRYDGHSEDAIDVPVSHFFGVGHDRAAYQSLPLGTDPDGGFYCYWPMPYRDGAVVELYNSTGQAINVDSASVEYEAGQVAADAGFLHAVYTEQTTTAGQQYHELLDVSGRGRYVGNMLYLQTPDVDRAILEGDDIITIDSDGPAPTVLYGTGLEDAYNGGYYYNHVAVQSDDGDTPYSTSGAGPYSGLLRMNFDTVGDDHVRTDQYRWLIADAIDFDDGLEVLNENFGNNGDVLFGSTAFYYALPPVPGDADLDGDVDLADFNILKSNFQAGTTWGQGDFDGNGIVDLEDFVLLKNNFTGANGEAAKTVIPEPSTACPLLACPLALRRRRKR